MTLKLSNRKELLDTIIPKNFGVGCRRPTVSVDHQLEFTNYISLEMVFWKP